MNISSEMFGSNSFDHFFFNETVVEFGFSLISLVDIITILSGFPINSYVIWLIGSGTGNGLAAEFFSLNLSICEMLLCVKSLLSLISYKVGSLLMTWSFVNASFTGRPMLQGLICVERYLAVAHPVTFLKSKSLRYRLICCVFAWVISFVSGEINIHIKFLVLDYSYTYFMMVHFSLFFSIQLFCLVAVLRALKRSGPGDRKRQEENHMKRRAFYVILLTTLAMLICFVPYMIVLIVYTSEYVEEPITCFGIFCFALAGLVQPLLFLYRVKKPPFSKCQ